MNNSFLLHGYYNYGHILLGVRPEDNALVLGVPGEFYVQEKVMASLFGFSEFKKMVNPYGNTENMGYWLRRIEEKNGCKGEIHESCHRAGQEGL